MSVHNRAMQTVCFIIGQQYECARVEVQNLALQFLKGWTFNPEWLPENLNMQAADLAIRCGLDSIYFGWNFAWHTATRILCRPGWEEPEPNVINLAVQYLIMTMRDKL